MDIENLLTKKTNLLENDSLSVFDGWAAQQNPKAFEAFYSFIKEVRPSRILEIGTSLGGFTRFLNEVCKNLNVDFPIRHIQGVSFYGIKKENLDNLISTNKQKHHKAKTHFKYT